MSHSRNNRSYAPLNEVNTPRIPAPVGIRNRDVDAYTGDQYDDAPQVLKQSAVARTNENVQFFEGNGQVIILVDLKKLRQVKGKEGKTPTADLYATGTFKTAIGVTIGLNVTRRYQAGANANVKLENATLENIGATQVRIVAKPKYIAPSSTGTTNLYVKVNGQFEVPGRGMFNISLNGYRKPGV